MEKSQVNAYLQRWQAVEAVETEELRAMSITERWKQLNALFGIGLALGFESDSASEQAVWERWQTLRKLG